MNDYLESLMFAFALNIRSWHMHKKPNFDELDRINRELVERYNVFAQVKNSYRDNECAVFYAGRKAWEDKLDPFYVIPTV